jgi:hypothetical protein
MPFMALRWAVASSAVCPPDRNTIPGTAAGTVDAGRFGAPGAAQHHVRLEQRLLVHHPLGVERRKGGVQRRLGDLEAPVDRVVAVHEHFRLDDRHQAGFLAQGRIPGEGLGVGLQAVTARQAVTDGDDRPPLREPGAELAVLTQPVAQAVEALGDLLARRPRQRLGAGVHLDPRQNALAGEHLDQRRAVGGRLADRLVKEDHAADVRVDAGGRKKELAIGPAVVLGRLDADRLEPLLDGRRALVRRQDALALGNERCSRDFKIVGAGHRSRSWTPEVGSAYRRPW